MKEIKIGDWGWFWDDDPEISYFNKLSGYDSRYPDAFRSYCIGTYTNFSHEHPTGRFLVTEKPNTVSNDPYAELKKAYEDGKTIQVFLDGNWEDCRWPMWSFYPGNCRIKPEPQYRAYNISDKDEFRDLWIQYDEYEDMEYKIFGLSPRGVQIMIKSEPKFVTYGDLLSDYKKAKDGTPFGKLLTPSEDISNTN